MTFKLPGQDEVVLKGEKGYSSYNLISAAKAERFIRKGCKAYLAHVVEVKQVNSSVRDIPSVCDFPDVFPEELPGLPPERDVEFTIDVLPGTTPVSM